MTRTEAAGRLRRIAYEIYGKLDEMEDILKELSLEELATARVCWMAHIDGALLNLKGWMGKSLISLEDTLTSLEEGITEEEVAGRSRG